MSDDLFDIFENDKHGKEKRKNRRYEDNDFEDEYEFKNDKHKHKKIFNTSSVVKKLFENKLILAIIIIAGFLMISIIIYFIILAVPHILSLTDKNITASKAIDVAKTLIN